MPTLGTLQDMFVDPEYAPLAADALLLYEQSSLVWLITEEHVIQKTRSAGGEAMPPTKAMAFLKRSPLADSPDFEAAIGQASISIGNSLDSADSCSYSLPVAAVYSASAKPRFDAVLEISFRTRQDLDSAWPSIFGSLSHAPLGSLLFLAESCGFVAAEERVIWPEREHPN